MTGDRERPTILLPEARNGHVAHPFVWVFLCLAYLVDSFIFFTGAYRGRDERFIVIQSLAMAPVIWITCDLSVALVIRCYRRFWMKFSEGNPTRDLIALLVVVTMAAFVTTVLAGILYATAQVFPTHFDEGYSFLSALSNGYVIAFMCGVSALFQWSYGIRDLKILTQPLRWVFRVSHRKARSLLGF